MTTISSSQNSTVNTKTWVNFFALAAAGLWLCAAAFGWQRALGGGWAFAACSLAAFGVISAAAFSFGAGALSACGFDETEDRDFHFPAAMTLGLGALALCVFALGVINLLYPVAAVLLLGAFLWTGRRKLAAFSPSELGITLGFWEILAGLLLAGALLLCFAPPTHYDSLVYHLALPQSYIINHSVAQSPNIYSHFPQNGEMLFTLCLLLGSDIAAQMISWLCAALALSWIYAYAKTLKQPWPEIYNLGGLAVFIAASHTAFLLLASISYVEAVVCLFVTASVISLLRWRTALGRQAWVWILLSGICCGLSVGTKYYAGITVVSVFIAGIYSCYAINRFSERKIRIIQMLAFAAVCAAVFAPWLIKNAVETGNPVYPFFSKAFGYGVNEANAYFTMLTEYGTMGSWPRELIRFPYTVFSNPSHFGGGMDALGIFGWDLMFAAVPLMFLAAWRVKELRWCCLYLLLHFTAWFVTAKVLRFLVVIVPLGSLMIAAGYFAARREGGRIARMILVVALLAFSVEHLVLWAGENNIMRNWDYLFGQQNRREHLSAMLPYYPCAAALNDIAAPAARVLIAGEQRSYFVRRAATATSLTAQNSYVTAANAAGNPQELAKTLARDYDWVIHVPREEQRLHAYNTLNFSETGRKNWDELMAAPPVFQGGTCSLYKL